MAEEIPDIDAMMESPIWNILDQLRKWDEELVKQWIYENWPHADGLYDWG
jgi:hypothetical protein